MRGGDERGPSLLRHHPGLRALRDALLSNIQPTGARLQLDPGAAEGSDSIAGQEDEDDAGVRGSEPAVHTEDPGPYGGVHELRVHKLRLDPSEEQADIDGKHGQGEEHAETVHAGLEPRGQRGTGPVLRPHHAGDQAPVPEAELRDARAGPRVRDVEVGVGDRQRRLPRPGQRVLLLHAPGLVPHPELHAEGERLPDLPLRDADEQPVLPQGTVQAGGLPGREPLRGGAPGALDGRGGLPGGVREAGGGVGLHRRLFLPRHREQRY
mmetsp:Transcript_33889/g.82194  ORF Transcript_33889/g.82194 Transcript_33889/m.82194 type:complete len:266 (+) Transcript_33889:189-986(+)